MKYGKNGKSVFKILKRFLDDLFQVFNGTTKQLHQIYEEINSIHPTLKFTMEHTSIENEPQEDRCACEEKQSIPFLDTSLSIENGRIEIDLHRKKTDRSHLRDENTHLEVGFPLRCFQRLSTPYIATQRLPLAR